MRIELSKQRRVSSFVPEGLLLDEKRARACRVCCEDCAVLDTRNDHIPVAYRARERAPRINYFSYIGLSADEYAFLQDALRTHTRILLQSPSGAILVFAEHLKSLGLLTVVRFRTEIASVSSIHRAILSIGRTEVRVSPSVPLSRAPCKSELCEQMRELFFYADEWMTRFPFSNGFRRGSVCIAALAGCDMECVSAMPRIHRLPQAEQARLAMFLFCLLLTMRQSDTASSSELDQAPKKYILRTNAVTAARSEPMSERGLTARFPFLACECFADFCISLEEGRLCLYTPLPKNTPAAVNSTDHQRMLLALCLEEIA